MRPQALALQGSVYQPTLGVAVGLGVIGSPVGQLAGAVPAPAAPLYDGVVAFCRKGGLLRQPRCPAYEAGSEMRRAACAHAQGVQVASAGCAPKHPLVGHCLGLS